MDKTFNVQNPRLGFVYVPYQRFENLYSQSEALKNGTIFKDLNIPFSEYSKNPIMNPFK
jgi:hypothetical protein